MQSLRTTYGLGLAALMAAAVTALACFFSAAPSECIKAAEEAGLPDDVIEQLRNPGDLNAIERAALNRILSEAGLDDVCEVAAGARESSDNPNSMRSDNPGVQTNSEQAGSENGEETDMSVQETIATQRSSRIPEDDEYRRRCQFWALNNLEPVVYAEFSNLDPDSMDDLDRILWRTKLNPQGHLGYYDNDNVGGVDVPTLLPRKPGMYCRDYWAEPINRSNAELRNHGFESGCRLGLESHITDQYRRLAEAARYQEESELVYQTPNQYVRILQWIDVSGDELLNSGNPPYRILQQQSRYSYAYFDGWIPTEEGVEDYYRENDSRLNLEWLGVLNAAGITDHSSLEACHYYYPQLFYGYWIPFDPDLMPDDNQEREIEILKYDSATMPLYLPESVVAERVKAGFPLGRTADGYHLCGDYYGNTEKVGYYYVEHPTGNYCERKQ